MIVDTPEGPRTGSAIREIRARKPLLSITRNVQYGFKGEAIAVDLGKRGYLFALLRGADGSDNQVSSLIYQLYPLPGEKPGVGGGTAQGVRYYRSLKADPVTLPIDLFPAIAAFKDINDPMSVILLFDTNTIWGNGSGNSPYTEINTNLISSHFGTGVSIRSITLELTEEKAQCDLHKILPWGPKLHRRFLDGGVTSAKAPYGLAWSQFSLGCLDGNS